MIKKVEKWFDKQEEQNNLWVMIPATFLFFGSVICFVILIIILFGG